MEIKINVKVGTEYIIIKEPFNKKRYKINPELDIETQLQMCLANFISFYIENADIDNLADYGYELIKQNEFNYILKGDLWIL